MPILSGLISVLLGMALVATACYYLFYDFRKAARNKELPVSMAALKLSYWLGIAGVAMLFLGVLHFMGMFPWWS